ncbi:hypothetical protein AV521_31880 [Streptomyces sp. IMTB 2501]|uniref:hypothetical protein n=1 Tax=Streptomyces sp. IMTB 2501 TaxID=1776340 RepID=UPI00096E6FF9|nr:hypothetical protein [Streptomyces sp. IMTB 2501]OLZ65298.1 hypothetical protein AV521_31880 [Streptomyces sp. IMTB 2501]
MEGQPPIQGPPPADGDVAERRDYAGAVYGSLLAASVVLGASLGSFPRLHLVLLLLGTAVVFWAAHVLARLFGERIMYVPVNGEEIRRVCAAEWPIIKAAVPPAVAVAVTPLLGIGPRGAAWLALGVALAGHVGWSTVATRRAGATGRMVVTAAAVNLVLGLLVVVLKVALTH